MGKQKEKEKAVTMDDIARQFLSAAPKPDRKAKPPKKAKPKGR